MEQIYTGVRTIVLVLIVAGSQAGAGENNSIYILQNSSGGIGNSLVIDQSAAQNSLVAGNASGNVPARQTGDGNTAEITLEGEGATVLFSQNNSLTSLVSGNSATISGGDLASIVLNQRGSGNVADLQVSGLNNSAGLRQFGDNNDGSVLVSGNNNSGNLFQQGDGNSYTLTVTGTDTNVTFRQIGDNLSSASGIGPSVISNGGTVQITQTVTR